MMGNPIGQWISINDNWLVVIDRYRPIYDQLIITSSSSLIAIDCYYLAGSLSMQLALWIILERTYQGNENTLPTGELLTKEQSIRYTSGNIFIAVTVYVL